MRFCLPFVLLACLQDQPQPAKDLINQLGVDDVAKREEAFLKLKQLGEAALPLLEEAARAGSPEVAARARELIRSATEVPKAIYKALKWLASNRHADGLWKPTYEDYGRGVTGLVLLAFLEGGVWDLPKEKLDGVDVRDVVNSGIRLLMQGQDADGCLVNRQAAKYVLSHAVCTMALCEASRVAPTEALRRCIQKATEFLLGAQNPGKGWRYSWRCGDNDTNVTTWALLALKAAEGTGIAIPSSAYQGIRGWLEQVCDETGAVGYTGKGAGRAIVDPTPQDYHRGTRAAMGLLTWTLLDRKKAHPKAVEFLETEPPVWGPERTILGYWFFGSLALHRHKGETSGSWLRWSDHLREALLRNQSSDGSWELPDYFYERDGGKPYLTAMAVLSLRVPAGSFRFLKAEGN